jgi:hypothetical protein
MYICTKVANVTPDMCSMIFLIFKIPKPHFSNYLYHVVILKKTYRPMYKTTN